MYKSADGATAEQTLMATVAERATLIVLPAHVVAFEQARYQNSNYFSLTTASNLIALDAMAAGRTHGENEHWQAQRIASQTVIDVDGQRIYQDGFDVRQVKDLPTPAQLFGPVRIFRNLVDLG